MNRLPYIVLLFAIGCAHTSVVQVKSAKPSLEKHESTVEIGALGIRGRGQMDESVNTDSGNGAGIDDIIVGHATAYVPSPSPPPLPKIKPIYVGGLGGLGTGGVGYGAGGFSFQQSYKHRSMRKVEKPNDYYIGFNPTQPMEIYKSNVVVVALGVDPKIVQQSSSMSNLPPSNVEPVASTPDNYASVQLDNDKSDDDYTITTTSNISQVANEDEHPATWIWYVVPKTIHPHDLVLSICFHAKDDGTDIPSCPRPNCIHTLDGKEACDPLTRSIQVKLSFADRIRYYLTEYTWVPIGVIGSAIMAIIGFIWKKNGKS